MMNCELIANLKKTAPSIAAVLDSVSPERRAAYFEAIQAFYMSRMGDTMFTGLDRHAKLVTFVASEQGWIRVDRLATRIYERCWKAEEQARVARELERQAAPIRRALEDAKMDLRAVQGHKAAAERRVERAEAELDSARCALTVWRESEVSHGARINELRRQIRDLGLEA